MSELYSGEKIKIEKADINKAQEILQLVKNSFAHYRQNKNNPDLEEELEDVKKDIEENIVLVIRNKGNNKIIGTLRLVPDNRSEKVYLKKFAISPEYQSQGLGTILFKQAENIAREQNIKKIYLHSSVEDKKLVKFYKKLGFECININTEMGYKRGLWVNQL